MSTAKARPAPAQISPFSTTDTTLISPVSSASSQPSSSTHSYGSSSKLPAPPPADRQPPPKARSVGPQNHTRFTLRRKDKDKEKGQEKRRIKGDEEGEDDWTLEGMHPGPARSRLGSTHGHDVLISPPSRENLRDIPPTFAERDDSTSMLDSQMTEMPKRALEPDKKEKKSRGRGLVKKTSKLFLRGDKDKGESSNPGSLAPRHAERQSSYSSATSTDSTVTSSSNGSMPIASVSAGRPPVVSSHSRRLSHDSQYSWQGGQSNKSGISSSTAQATGLESRRMSSNNSSSSGNNTNNLSASVPALSRNSLPQPGPSRVGQQETIPSRMSSWFTNFLPSASSATIFESPANQEPQSSSSPARKGPSAAASFLYAARQKAVDGVRNLLDSEAQPDKSPETIWVMGVAHPGYRPSSPFDSPASSSVDLPMEGVAQRRSSSSSGTASPSFKSDQAALRPTVWPKKKDTPQGTTSPPPKGIGNLFSPSSLALALPSTSSPSKDSGQLDSPGKGKKKEREIIKWPEQFHADFRTRIWCTYRSQYAPIVSLSNRLLIPTPEAYYAAFASPREIISDLPQSTSLNSTSLPNRPSTSAWSWARNGEERGLTSDAGWGCMLRTGQSMLANALIHLHLGRDWRMSLTKPDEGSDQLDNFATHVRILSWFFDDPSPLCPFSVHRMALIGKELGKEVGEWFGPSTAAGALKTLANSFPPCGISVVSATDSMIYKSDVYGASSLPSDGWFDEGTDRTASKRSSSERGRSWGNKAVLVLVGLRLGLDGVNPIYYESIKTLFSFPQSVGIAGGRPSSSYYFVGTQGDSLFYLDPHFTRPAVPLKTPPAPATRDPPRPHWQTSTSSASPTDLDEAVIIDSPNDKPARETKPLTTYALDEVDVDDLSDSSSTTSSPTNRVRRSTIRAVNLDEHTTPPSSPTRKSRTHTPHSPTTPLAPSPSKPAPLAADLGPAATTIAPERTQSRCTAGSGDKDAADASRKWYISAYTEAQLRSFHCEKVKKIPLSNVDPSMLLGFLCKNEADFDDFCDRVSKMPRKIFTVQDEPPTWDDNDDPGMESVSDASSGRERDLEARRTSISGSTSDLGHGTPIAAPTPIPIPSFDEEQEQELETLRDEEDDFDTSFDDTITRRKTTLRTAKTAMEVEANADSVAATKRLAIAKAEIEQGDEEETETHIPRPPKPRPLQSMGPVGTDSWNRPAASGDAAPNGRSVI